MPQPLEGVMPSAEIRARLKAFGLPVILGCSGGKDSTAAWIALLEDGIEVVPVHLYVVPGLGFVEEHLEYLERWFGTPILRYPHSSFYRIVGNKLFQPKHRSAAIDRCKLHLFGLSTIMDGIRQDIGLFGSWEADGLKACDSLERRTLMRTHGPTREKSLKCSVIWDWSSQEVRDYLDSFGIKGPPDYAMFGTSFDGLSSRFTREIKKNYPEDYEIMKAWFPLIDIDIEREDTYGV